MAYIEKITSDMRSFFTIAAAIVQPFFAASVFQSSSPTNKSPTIRFSPRQNVIVQSTELASNLSSGVIATAKK